ncbi:transmembrane protein 198-like isoform X1 [Tachypleus tridentatus]|uniref:transmembrane protein 198-like isoform X1 n=2 Tax=Tachypleus tridentatus TaxID=6853 RepID=UPI003FD1DFAF
MALNDDSSVAPSSNNTVLGDEEDTRCLYFDYNYDVTTAVVCGMYLVFGVVYTLYGYRCFKAVMFLTGFIFGSVVVYLICLEESLLSTAGNSGVALGAGLLFGLITMLVQYVGLFMTGFHMGLFVGVASIMIAYLWYSPTTVWITVGILLGCGLVGAVVTLFFQKGCTILGTSIYGGAIIAASSDYFIEKFTMLYWVWDRVRVAPSPTPCWFSWLILGIWPFMVLVGSLTQWKITGRGTHHEEMRPSRKARQVNLQRIRREETRAEQRQRKYRYLYQVRTAHGDVISQSYIQSLQTKVCPPDDSLTTIHSDLTRLTVLNPSASTNTTLSQVA